jgi:hypothetical protein
VLAFLPGSDGAAEGRATLAEIIVEANPDGAAGVFSENHRFEERVGGMCHAIAAKWTEAHSPHVVVTVQRSIVEPVDSDAWDRASAEMFDLNLPWLSLDGDTAGSADDL